VCGSEKLVRTSTNPTISVFEETMLSGLWNSYPLESMWSVLNEDGKPSICGIESFNLFSDEDCTVALTDFSQTKIENNILKI
jgi:hypothetical protein